MGELAEESIDRALAYDDSFCDELSLLLSEKNLVEQDFANRIWETQDGERIPLKLMKTKHIENCIAFIRKGARIRGMADKWLPVLEEELKRRG